MISESEKLDVCRQCDFCEFDYCQKRDCSIYDIEIRDCLTLRNKNGRNVKCNTEKSQL